MPERHISLPLRKVLDQEVEERRYHLQHRERTFFQAQSPGKALAAAGLRSPRSLGSFLEVRLQFALPLHFWYV